MISVEEALHHILSHKLPNETELVELKDALGRVLGEPVIADRDAPPFDRVSMDGIAIKASALQEYNGFAIEKIQAAGAEQTSLSSPGNCVEVMTGAVLPMQTDCVIPYEQIEIKDRKAYPLHKDHTAGQNVHSRGKDAKKGDTLLHKGKTISPTVAGILASVGMQQVRVVKYPKIAICSTGDELVNIDQQPLPHQIRKSNAIMLESALMEWGLRADSYHLPDDQELMTRRLASLMEEYDVILFSGAVSRGKYDFLPLVLEELGMEKVIHGVAQRPGKPFLFGNLANTLIFGFPGNPVSTFVCFHLYFKAWLRQHMGLPTINYSATLGSEFLFDKPLSYHLLVSVIVENGVLVAMPVANSGSGDLVHLAQADGLLTLPREKAKFAKGEAYPLTFIRKDLFCW